MERPAVQFHRSVGLGLISFMERGDHRVVQGTHVSDTFFRTLGVTPILGPRLLPGEDEPLFFPAGGVSRLLRGI